MPSSAAMLPLALLMCVLAATPTLACRPINASLPCPPFEGTPEGVIVAAAASFPTDGIVVPIRWTLLLPGSVNVTRAILTKQLNVLNAAFAPSKIRFTTDSIVYKQFAGDCQATQDVAAQLVAETALPAPTKLNVIVCPMARFLGIAFIDTDETNPYSNTLFINPTSLPGGLKPTDLGATMTHEVGHTMGLRHVFEARTCTRDGDFVADTPIQRTPSSGCPTGKDSCPTSPGLDAIHNYMDYSDDACMTGFTPGQIARVRHFASNYKKSLFPPSLTANNVRLKLVGRSNCAALGRSSGYVATYQNCGRSEVILRPKADAYSLWEPYGGNWASRVKLANAGRFGGACATENLDEFLVQAPGSPSYQAPVVGSAATDWTLRWLGNNLVRVQSASGLYLSFSRICGDEFPYLTALGTTYLNTFQISFAPKP